MSKYQFDICPAKKIFKPILAWKKRAKAFGTKFYANSLQPVNLIPLLCKCKKEWPLSGLEFRRETIWLGILEGIPEWNFDLKYFSLEIGMK